MLIKFDGILSDVREFTTKAGHKLYNLVFVDLESGAPFNATSENTVADKVKKVPAHFELKVRLEGGGFGAPMRLNVLELSGTPGIGSK